MTTDSSDSQRAAYDGGPVWVLKEDEIVRETPDGMEKRSGGLALIFPCKSRYDPYPRTEFLGFGTRYSTAFLTYEEAVVARIKRAESAVRKHKRDLAKAQEALKRWRAELREIQRTTPEREESPSKPVAVEHAEMEQ